MSQPGVVPGAVFEFAAARALLGTGPGINSPLTTEAFDTSGNGNHGTLTNFGGTTASGYAGVGSAADPHRLVFAGDNDFVGNDAPTGLDGAALTVEMWFIPPAAQGAWADLITYKSAASNDNYGWRVVQNGSSLNQYVLYWGTGAAKVGDTTPIPLTAGTLEHVGWTHDGSTVRRYRGAAEFGVANTGESPIAYNASVFRLMKTSYYATYAAGGLLIARVYPVALTPEQWAQNDAAGIAWEPLVTTTAISGTPADTATTGGNVTSQGNAAVTARGVCWSMGPIAGPPTIADARTSDGAGAGAFASTLTGLERGKTYSCRAYATNAVGTAYGAELSFTTVDADLPLAGTGQFVWEGNSRPAGYGASATRFQPFSILAARMPAGWTSQRPAYGGREISQQIIDATGVNNHPDPPWEGDATSQTIGSDDYYDPGLAYNIVAGWEFVNELAHHGGTAASIYALYRQWCLDRKARGWTVIACTDVPYYGIDYSILYGFNQLLRTHWREFADYLCDYGADPRIGYEGAEQDLDYWDIPAGWDGWHMGDAGQAIAAELMADALIHAQAAAPQLRDEPVVRPHLSLLIAPPGSTSPTDTLTDEMSGVSWSDGQHGPASLSCMIPGKKFRALRPELVRGGRLWLMVNGKCRWSGSLAPVRHGLATGGLLPLDGRGQLAEAKNDETFCWTGSDADVGQWFLRKGSSGRLTYEADGTLLLSAEGGNTDGSVFYKSGIKIELVYMLNGGLETRAVLQTIDHLSFLWNIDLGADWRCYIDEWTDAWAGVKLSRLWTQKNLTSAGEVVDLACSAGCRALVFGLTSEAKNSLAVDTFAELSSLVISTVAGTPTIDEAMAAIAGELTSGTITTAAIGEGRDDLVLRPGEHSRSSGLERFASLAEGRVDWRFVCPEQPGADDFIAQPMLSAPPDRSRWYVVRSTDPGVDASPEYDSEEGMDVAAVYYGKKDGNLLVRPSPSLLTTAWPDEWTKSGAGTQLVADSYAGHTFIRRSFVLDSDPDTTSEMSATYATETGREYRVGCVVERASAVFGPAFSIVVRWLDAGGTLISDDGPDPVSSVELTAVGTVLVLSKDMTAPASAAYASVSVGVSTTGAAGSVGVRDIHLDIKAPGGSTAIAYSPAAPTSVVDRVRPFDYRDQRLTTAEAQMVAGNAMDWYGPVRPFGSIGIEAPIETVDRATVYPWEITTGDWVSILDDDAHEWPQMVMGADHGDDGRTVIVSLSGDAGDFGYMGRADSPDLQKRARKKGLHKHISWARYNRRQKAKEKQQARRDKAAQRRAKKNRPKYAPG